MVASDDDLGAAAEARRAECLRGYRLPVLGYAGPHAALQLAHGKARISSRHPSVILEIVSCDTSIPIARWNRGLADIIIVCWTAH